MKDIGLLFTDEMVRAYLEGRKTQTRRPIKWAVNQVGEPADHLCEITATGRWIAWWGPSSQEACQKLTDRAYGADDGFKAPFQPDDRVWVRECWTTDHAAFYPNFPILYRADGYDPASDNTRDDPPHKVYSPEQKAWYPFRWHPSIHMKREHARLVLPIVSVRVERVQDITEQDARAEGVQIGPCGSAAGECTDNTCRKPASHREAFLRLWRELYGAKYPPETSWCWVIETEPYQGATK